MGRGLRTPVGRRIVGGSVLLAASLIVTGLIAAPAPAGLSGVSINYENDPIAIPNGHGAARMIFDEGGLDDTGGVSVGLRVRHSRTQQLDVSLKGPNGSEVELTRGETRGENFGAGRCRDGEFDSADYTSFSDSSSLDIADGTAPYAAIFIPREPLSVFTSPIPAGKWKLIVKDTQGGADGKLLCGIVRIPYDPS